jgi:Sulfotransferase family
MRLISRASIGSGSGASTTIGCENAWQLLPRRTTRRQYAGYELYADAQGKSAYGDKTPAYVRRIAFLADRFPQARFIHLIRDGRNVATSLLENRLGHRRLNETAQYWADCVIRSREAGLALQTTRYREVRYEELVMNPSMV